MKTQTKKSSRDGTTTPNRPAHQASTENTDARDRQTAPVLPESCWLFLARVYDQITVMKYDEAVGRMGALGELIAHHPALKIQACAARQIAEADQVIAQLRAKAAEDQVKDEDGQVSAIGMIELSKLLEGNCAHNYRDAVCCLEGMGDLIQHHPALQVEAAAIRLIVRSENVLNGLRTRAGRAYYAGGVQRL